MLIIRIFIYCSNEPDEVSLTCSCTSKQGASGSPLILPRIDRVVGVLAGASHASVYAVPVTHIREFLIEWLGGDEDLVKSLNFIATCFILAPPQITCRSLT